MAFSRRLSSLLLSVALGASGALVAADAPTPLFTVSLSDQQRLLQHWDAGLIATAWQDPGVAALRARFAQESPAVVEQVGLDPLVLVRAIRGAQLQVLSSADGPALLAQADLGGQAQALFAVLAAKGTADTVAGADAACSLTGLGATGFVERHGTTLLFSSAHGPQAVQPIPGSAHDLDFSWNGPALARMGQATNPELSALLVRLLPALRGSLDLVPHGLALQADLSGPWSWLVPYEPRVIARLPDTTTEVSAWAISGERLWQELGAPLQQAWRNQHPDYDDHPLQGIGLDLTIRELVEGLSGTWALVASPGAPLPGYSLLIPRTPVLDRIAAALIAKAESAVPAEGQTIPLLISGLPVMLTVGRDAGHWVVTTDAVLAQSWLAGTNDWDASPLGKVAAAQRRAGTLAMSVSDTPTQLRQLAMAAGMVPNLTPTERQATAVLVQRLAALAKPSFTTLERSTSDQTAPGLHFASEGVVCGTTLVAPIAIIAAIAIPNLLESRTTANEAAAAATLKSGVFPSQIQFQAGAYIDHDNDGRGEYAPELALLAGKTDATVTREPSLLPPAFNAPQPVRVGAYFYSTSTFGDAETNFVTYAWPATPSDGRRSFALTITGVVYETPATATAPGIYALWGDQPVAIGTMPVDPRWKPYTSSGARTAKARQVARDENTPRRHSGKNIRQLVLATAVYQNDNDQVSPPDFAKLYATFPDDLTPKLLKDPGAPEYPAPYLYVRPASNATSQQPMIVEDPAVWKGEGCLVGYCDGHLGWIAKPAAQRVWELAKQLADSPQAKGDGLGKKDWAAVQQDLNQSQEP